MPFGFVQLMICLLGCWGAAKLGKKGPILVAILIPCVLGSALLYGEY